MKQILISIARSVPKMLEHSTFQVSLQGWPAATAVAVIGVTIVATVIVLGGNHGDRETE